MSISHDVIGEIPYFNVFIWVLCAIVQQYTCSYETDCLNKGVYKFLAKWSIMQTNDTRMQDAFNLFSK